MLLDVREDRYGGSSTVVTSQIEPDLWHAVIGEETATDSICDLPGHNAHRIKLAGLLMILAVSVPAGQMNSR